MRKYISIIFGALLLSLVACTEEVVDPNAYIGDGNKIILSVKSPSAEVTRSADTDVESALALIDVYIMDENYEMVYKERLDNTASPVYGEGKFTLEKGRDEFEEGKKYFVYIVANSTVEMAEMADDWAELKSLTQTNSNVHLSGMNIQQVASGDMPPKYFLMDGHAYVGNSEPENMTAYVINDKNTEDTILKATLYRAAAKIVVNLIQGESVEFHKLLENATPLYSFYQLPISTLVVNPAISGLRHNSEKQTTLEWGLSTNNFNWTEDENSNPVITYVGYAYANDWSNKNAVNESSLLFSIPMKWDADGNGSKEKNSPVNWYKVPVSKTDKFERNKCYVLNVKINAVGAEDKNVPIELRDIEYVTLDWEKVKVNIGENEARYLTLNTDLVKIYDKNFDLDQLTFTSSSPIKSIKLKDVFNHNERMEGKSAFSALKLTEESNGTTEAKYETGDGVFAYYIDKFGQKIQLGTDPGFDISIVDNGYEDYTKDQIIALENNLYKKAELDPSQQYIRAEVPDEYKRALNGDIHIFSPINADGSSNVELNWNSHFNTVRYLEFEVMNEQGITATFRVEQRPTVVITNEEGYFSYRSDQKLTDDQEEASHYHNYLGGRSLHCTGLYFYHEHEWSKEFEMTEEWWNTNRNDRDYSWVVPQACPPNQSNSGVDVVNYGYIGNPVTYTNSSGKIVNGLYGGLSRPTTAPTDYFLRWRFNGIGASNNDSQGLAMSGLYKKQVMVDGELVEQWFRKHYVWNVQIIFYNRYVGHVYKTDEANRKKGQADIHSMFHSVPAQQMTIDSPGEGWASWSKQGLTNHRMYNIHTSNTHSDYTIGYPVLLEDAVPRNTPDNAKLISPNLMVASQLGETYHQSIINSAKGYNYKVPVVGEFYKIAQEHCREYVETTFIDKPDANGIYNGVWDQGEEVIHYDDWRLPTKAEIDRIIEFQETSRAMDKLLVGEYYFCITGNGEDADVNVQSNWVSVKVPNFTEGQTGYYIRCVRDAGRKK